MPRIAASSALLLALGLVGNLPVAAQPGEPQRPETLDLSSEVEGRTTILYLKPQGSRVSKGELVGLLDSAGLRANLDTQKIATEGAKANLENAEKTLEVAKISVRDYQEGTYKRSIESAEKAIVRAEGDLEKAKGNLRRAEEKVKAGDAPETKLTQEKLNSKRAQIVLEESKSKMRVLKEFTYPKTMTELKAEVEKALSDKLSKETTYNRERQKEEKFRRQIEKCKLYAPADGIVLYANTPRGPGPGPVTPIEEGATVRERQIVFRIVPDGGPDRADPR